MYAGRIVEEGDIEAVFENPRHPYTRGLLGAIPQDEEVYGDILRLAEIKGHVPRPGLAAAWLRVRTALSDRRFTLREGAAGA